MEDQETVTVTLTKDEALILFDALGRFVYDKDWTKDEFEFDHKAERVAFSDLLGCLEEILAEPFSSEYGENIEAARARLARRKFGSDDDQRQQLN